MLSHAHRPRATTRVVWWSDSANLILLLPKAHIQTGQAKAAFVGSSNQTIIAMEFLYPLTDILVQCSPRSPLFVASPMSIKVKA